MLSVLKVSQIYSFRTKDQLALSQLSTLMKGRIFVFNSLYLSPHLLSSSSLVSSLVKYQDHRWLIKILPHIKQKHVHQILLCVLINILYFKFCTLRLTLHPNILVSGCLLCKTIQLIVISVQKYKYNITLPLSCFLVSLTGRETFNENRQLKSYGRPAQSQLKTQA